MTTIGTLALRSSAPTIYFVSLFIEILRVRPVQVFWFATLSQAALWLLVPTLFYASPPGNLPEVLAIGREFVAGSHQGPPLAFWLAEAAYLITGHRLFGVYLLSQACIIATYWAVFELGRLTVGLRHAVLVVLLMVGISVFAVPSPEFGPQILTMALWALALLHGWRAVGLGQRFYWYVLAADIVLLMATSSAALMFIALFGLFIYLHDRGRALDGMVEPWLLGIALVVALFPHLVWLQYAGSEVMPALSRLRSADAYDNNLLNWLWQFGGLLVVHAGLLVMVALGTGWPRPPREPAPVIERSAVDPWARRYIYFFALMPAAAATLIAVITGRPTPVGGTAPLVVLSGLVVVLAGGDIIKVHYQRLVGFAWCGLLIVPPLLTAIIIIIAPWTFRLDLRVSQPAYAMGQFFADTFERRTGRPLAIVAGDRQTAELVALGAPQQPSVFRDAMPERTPWVTWDDVKKHGAVVVWPTTDTAGAPPAALKERFPGLVPEVPRAFPRPVQGLLPLVRIGWAVIRPQDQTSIPPAATVRPATPVQPSVTPVPGPSAPAPAR